MTQPNIPCIYDHWVTCKRLQLLTWNLFNQPSMSSRWGVKNFWQLSVLQEKQKVRQNSSFFFIFTDKLFLLTQHSFPSPSFQSNRAGNKYPFRSYLQPGSKPLIFTPFYTECATSLLFLYVFWSNITGYIVYPRARVIMRGKRWIAEIRWDWVSIKISVNSAIRMFLWISFLVFLNSHNSIINALRWP